MFWTSIAHAMPNAAAGDGAAANPLVSFMPLILMVIVFYMLAIRPQRKKQQAHNAMLAALQKGEYILTNTGIFARIVEIKGDIMTVDMDGTQVRMLRSAIAARTDADGKIDAPAGRK